MDVRKTYISQMAAKLSDADLMKAFKEIVEWRDTGVLNKPSTLAQFSEETNSDSMQTAENAVLMELGRRYVSQHEQMQDKYNKLCKGDAIWYLDSDTGEIERGTVFDVLRKDGKVQDFSVEFEDDFDEFYGSALGSCFFLTESEAISAREQARPTQSEEACNGER